MNDTSASPRPALLELKEVTIAYNGHDVVHDLSFNLKQGDIGCLLGPSGCGKTTALLRPDDIIHDDASPLQADKAFRGAEILYTLRLPSGSSILSLVPSHHDHPLGEKIGIRLAVDHVVAFRR